MEVVTGREPTRCDAIVALDVSAAAAALALVDALGDGCRFYKVGHELFTAEGPAIVQAVIGRGADVFLDLKFHDIPNTVRGGVRSAARLGARLVTVHASGGRAMLAAAAEGAREAATEGARCEVLAVSVLTSLTAADVADAWGRPAIDVRSEVLRLAELTEGTGVHGLVCSGHEAAVVHERFGTRLETLVPGVRVSGSAAHDQARIVTPAEARRAGARYVVLGRAVTGASEPARALREIVAQGRLSV